MRHTLEIRDTTNMNTQDAYFETGGCAEYCDESRLSDAEHRLSPAWWIIPAAIGGCVFWVYIIRSAIAWIV